MDIEFSQVRNQPVRRDHQALEIGGDRFQLNDMLNVGEAFGPISVRSIAETVEQFTRITHGECQAQLAFFVFTVTANPRALELYFPMMQSYTEQEKEDFYEFVESLAQHPNLDVQLIRERRIQLPTQTFSGIRYLVAGHIAELFFHRRELAQGFFAAPRHFQLYATARAFAKDGGVAGGDYNPSRESIQLVVPRLFEGFFGPTAGVCPFLHEFGHMLDHFEAGTGAMGRPRGLLPGLSPADGALFRPRARALFMAGKRLEMERYHTRYQGGSRPTDPLPIGHPYVFQNDGEFIAGYLEMFFRNPNYFADQNPDLYMSFAEVFGCDPREAWPEDFPFYIDQNRQFYRSGQRPWVSHLSLPND